MTCQSCQSQIIIFIIILSLTHSLKKKIKCFRKMRDYDLLQNINKHYIKQDDEVNKYIILNFYFR